MKDKNTAAAQTYLREKCGAYRGHPEWRALEQAFLAGAESASAGQRLHQIQEPPTKTEALAHYSQQAILAMGAPVAHPHHCTARSADGACEECEGHAQEMREWKVEQESAAPVVLPEPDAQAQRAEGIKQVAKMLKKRADAYADEHLSTDPDTGATEGSEAHIEYWNWLLELVDDVRALLAAVSAQAAPEEQSLTDDDAADLILETMAVHCQKDAWHQAIEVHRVLLSRYAEAAPQARDAESDYQRGYRHGYNRRDAEVQGALL